MKTSGFRECGFVEYSLLGDCCYVRMVRKPKNGTEKVGFAAFCITSQTWYFILLTLLVEVEKL